MLFRQKNGNPTDAEELYALLGVRIRKPLNLFYDDATHINEIMKLNVLYHLANSFLQPSFFLSNYKLSFDTTQTGNSYYNIRYRCDKFTSEFRGSAAMIEGQRLPKEAEYGWEEGNIIIDRKDFSIRSIERNATGRPNFPYKYNFILPELLYYTEFISGNLRIDLVTIAHKTYVSRIVNSYTNHIFHRANTADHYLLTNYLEWYALSYNRGLTKKLFEVPYYSDLLFYRQPDSGDARFWCEYRHQYYYEHTKTMNAIFGISTDCEF